MPILTILFLWLTPAMGDINRCGEFKSAVASGSPSIKLERFFAAHWKYLMTELPEFATHVGYPGQDHRWTDQSLAARARRKREEVCALDALNTIPRHKLAHKERVNYDLMAYRLKRYIDAARFPFEYLAINHLDGFQIESVEVLASMRKASTADFENILKRLEALPEVVEQSTEALRAGLKAGVTSVKMFLPKVSQQIDALLEKDLKRNPLYEPFLESEAKLQERAAKILRGQVFPSLKKFKEFLHKEYIPGARETTSWSALPNGKEWYEQRIRYNTTTAMNAEQLHALGLSEVKRLRAEMDKVRKQAGFKGTLKSFNQFLLRQRRFYHRSAADLLADYRNIAKKMDAELPRLFKTLPRSPYGIRAIPAYQAKSAPSARYQSGSVEAGRPGWFEANTHDLDSRPKWEMETLTFHEAVPGHHLQVSMAHEITGLPEFRRYGGFTAFSEGWALYAEGLGAELGFFKDPYSKYGNLTAEMMRAVRLVLDTGLHAQGWSKQKALDYYREQMPITDHDSEIEVDRYITWPGQALAYKVGQLKFRELRARAAAQLGERFDVREFHDEVLRHGSLPMEVLEQVVNDWLAQMRSKSK